MKRKMIYAFMVTIAFILSACGANSIEDVNQGSTPTSPDSNVSGKITTLLQGITIDKNTGDVAANIVLTSTYESKVVATLDKMNITLGGCPLVNGSVQANPNSVTFDAANPSRNVVLSGKMTDANCIPTSYRLFGTNTVVSNGKTVVENFTSGNQTIAQNSIVFQKRTLEAIDKVLEINTSAEKAIRIRFSKGAEGISGKNIKAGTVLAGSLFSPIVQTNEFGQATFAYTPPSPITDQNFTIKFCLEEDSSVCTTTKIVLKTGQINDNNDTNSSSDLGNDFVNYGLIFKADDNTNTLGLDERKSFSVALIDKDTKAAIPATQITKITMISNKPKVITLIDPSDAIGAAVDKLEFTGRNNIKLYLKASKETSGLSDIKITVEYKNTKGFDRVLSKTYAITVLSGPPTTLTITDAGTSYNKETKDFEQKFMVSAVDKYSNKINTSPTISVSVMAGYTKDSNDKRIVFGQNSTDKSANLTKGTPAILDIVGTAPLKDFDKNSLQGVDLTRDFVSIFGNVRTYEANGKWEIEDVLSASKLSLKDSYEGENYTQLGFAIGHNYRSDVCSDEYIEYKVNVDSTDGTYKLDDEGKTFVTVKYPAAYMPGKRVGVVVNLITQNPETGKQLRGGEVKYETLYRHAPFNLKGASIQVPKGQTITFVHYGTVTTGTGDNFALLDSTFTCSTNKSSNIVIVQVLDEIQTDDLTHTRCLPRNSNGFGVNDHQSFKIYRVTATAAEDGTFVLDKCTVDKEFSF